MQAARCGEKEIVELLLAAGADPNTDRGGEALYAAAREGHADIAELLLGGGADPNADEGEALLEGARRGHKDIVKLLLEAGADRTPVRNDGKTALEIAEEKGHAEVAALLRDANECR